MEQQPTARTNFSRGRFGSQVAWGVAAVVLLALRSVGCSSDQGQSGTPGAGGISVGAGGAAAAPGVATCGNNVVEPGEMCDGVVQTTCAAATNNVAPVGSVRCTACNIDLSGCTTAGAGGSVPGSGGIPFGAGSATSGGATSASGGFLGIGGVPGSGGTLGAGGSFGTGGTSFGSGGTSTGTGGAPFGSGGESTGSGGTAGSTSMGGSSGVLGNVDALRQACADTINMYRAMKSLAPLTLASASVETCSDTGAQSDATTMMAHGSAGKCPGMGAQDTCPGWPPQQYGGAEGALKACLMSMWNEGEPPEGRQTCINEYFSGNIACFEKYGHYLNMSDPSNTVVSCGFYVMPNGALWMNQDFGH